jgi:hypothetical protein
MDELQFFPLVFNFDIRGFDIHGTLVARINRIYRGLRVLLLYNYDFILRSQSFITLYSNRRYIDASFLINTFKGKINWHSFMETVCICVPTSQM